MEDKEERSILQQLLTDEQRKVRSGIIMVKDKSTPVEQSGRFLTMAAFNLSKLEAVFCCIESLVLKEFLIYHALKIAPNAQKVLLVKASA